MNQALILFAHGARDPEWANPLRRVRDVIARQLPEQRVELAFLEFMTPTLEESVGSLVGAGCQQIAIVPLFIAQGGHLKRELPQMVDALRSTYPAVTFSLSTPVGEHPDVIAAMAGAALDLAGLSLA